MVKKSLVMSLVALAFVAIIVAIPAIPAARAESMGCERDGDDRCHACLGKQR
jgi:hypothetical protein